MMKSSPPILAAEDEESDAFLLRYAFQKAAIANPLVVVSDGLYAIQYLNREPPFADRAQYPLPKAILLDLKMPRMSGFDVLRWLAGQPELNAIPAYVLSSSSASEDARVAAELGARGYFVKPHALDEYIAIIRGLPVVQPQQV